MEDFLKSFVLLSENVLNYKKEITSNDNRVDTLEELAKDSQCPIPKQFFNAMRQIDVQHFVVQFDDLMQHAAKEFETSLESVLKMPDVVSYAKDIIYSLKMPAPLSMLKDEYSTDLIFDALRYCLLDLNSRDDVCELVSNNGYLPALMGVGAASVTSFNLYPHLHGFPESCLRRANYSKGNIKIIPDKVPYKKSLYSKNYSGAFSKIYSHIALNQNQYAQCKKLLKPGGWIVASVIESPKEIMLVLYQGGEDIELIDFVEPISILPDGLTLN